MIKKAYRKESLRHHPDRNKGDETEAARRFMLANEAYDALKTALEDATDGAIAELNRQYDADVAKSAFKDMLRTEDIEAWHAFDYVKDHCCELEGWKEAKMGDRRQAFAEYLGECVAKGPLCAASAKRGHLGASRATRRRSGRWG
ncbi:hypothetical protein M885DRAFT_107106 [Pelagophyceae sp. CCMP2097]|nr:hypothetical protein M885DRAFT_107106 [Pelagophyceae sp. CCMP2097]